jgi:hypothetical protein
MTLYIEGSDNRYILLVKILFVGWSVWPSALFKSMYRSKIQKIFGAYQKVGRKRSSLKVTLSHGARNTRMN